ncbi:MAG: EAL domain-containing protein [Burkholderiales bacterium]|nr:EAL domain-containing protein [Burkholderiales bacterium]
MTPAECGPVLDAMIEAVCLVDPKTLRIIASNQALASLVGIARADFVGKPVVELTNSPEDLFFWEDVAAGLADSILSESRLRCIDGVAIPVERKVSRVWLNADYPVFLVGVRDLRQQRLAEEQLEDRMAELRATLESTGDGILVVDTTGAVRHYNRRFVELWNVPPELPMDDGGGALFAHLGTGVQDEAGYRDHLESIANDPNVERTDVILLRSGRMLERVTLPQTSRSRVVGRVYSFRDLTERLDAQKRIETLAYTDVLTGLPNRLLLGQRVAVALRTAQRTGATFAVLFIDLDRFKNINDSLGHSFGDQALIEASARIQQTLREVDTLCRVGGDEFIAFLQEADAFGAEIVARRILDKLSQPFMVDAVNFSLGCSIGVAMYPEDGRNLDTLIQCADTAMFRVKERGRGNFRFYQPQMNVDLLSRVKMDHAMRQAMEQGLFRLHYQPQISLNDGHLLGVEALIRWNDADMGNVSPATFIPLAEESGFIVTIGNWVLEEAVRQALVWQTAGSPVVVSINVSALQFQQGDFVERVASAIHGAGLNPALLELELTESILIKDVGETLARLHALSALGVSLAIDDFGTGYSSLAYLKKFPISKLKIDRAFVMGLPGDEGDRAIVSATVAMASALKLSVVAEGVETAAQRDYLQELHCGAFQGFLCAPGLPAAEFERLRANLPQGKKA